MPAKGNSTISVVVPAYQAEGTIKRCIKSAFGVGKALLEVIVIDDGSTDGTARIVGELAADEPRIRLIRQTNRGRAAARNAGFYMTHGDWVVFLDADDYMFPGDYGELAAAADERHLDIVVCMHSRPGFAGLATGDIRSALLRLSAVSGSALSRAMIEGGIDALIDGAQGYDFNASWGRLYRRSLIEDVVACLGSRLAPFPTGLRFSEDRLFNLECLWRLGDGCVGFVPFAAYYWDVNSSSTCAKVRTEDVESLKRFIGTVAELDERFVLSSGDSRLVVAREFMEQFKKAAKVSRGVPQLEDAWLASFSNAWLRDNLVTFPSDSLGHRREWCLAAVLLSRGHMRAAFRVYGMLARLRQLAR